MKASKSLTVLNFSGPRFEDHGLDVDVLPEIVAYEQLLQETAKELWRRKNPRRQRLPKNFDAVLSLKFFELRPGSTGIPLVRDVVGRPAPQLPFEDELDEAACLLQASIYSAGTSEGPPAALPRSVIPLFQDFGKTLEPEEFIVITTDISPAASARYDSRVRTRILSWSSSVQREPVDLTGEVRGTDLDGLKFTLRLPDGKKVAGHFESSQEATVLEALGEHTSRRLQVIGEGEFAPEDGTLLQISRVDRVELIEPETSEPPTRPIWQRLAEITATVPEAVWKDLPRDLAKNLDNYLYGNKK